MYEEGSVSKQYPNLPGSRQQDFYLFGNVMSKKALAKARRRYLRLARRHGNPDSLYYPLTLHSAAQGASIFGMRYLKSADHPQKWSGADGADYCDLSSVDNPIIIGTIRMGFGHYRIALALASVASFLGYTPVWLDLLENPKTIASKIITGLEGLYSWGSRLSERLPLFNALIWEKVTDRIARRLEYQLRDWHMSRFFAPSMRAIPEDIPFLSVHPWAAQAAIHGGLKRVITAIPDNLALAFHLAPGSIHCVQGPSAYQGYRTLRNMGRKGQVLKPMSPEHVKYSGHFVDHELVVHAQEDCDRRIRRHQKDEPRRFLLTIGGAGAQMKKFQFIIRQLSLKLRKQRLALFVNLGDHGKLLDPLLSFLEDLGLDTRVYRSWEDSFAFAREAYDSPVHGVHVFLHDEVLPAVYITNLLMRSSDLLITKPSELSFYPVPKLFIQRVGRHEAWGAIRGAEIGDSTMETVGENNLIQTLNLLSESPDLIPMMCENILNNLESGIYHGAYKVIDFAVQGSGSSLESTNS